VKNHLLVRNNGFSFAPDKASKNSWTYKCIDRRNPREHKRARHAEQGISNHAQKYCEDKSIPI